MNHQKPYFETLIQNQHPKIYNDPISLPHRYQDPKNIEVAAFVASVFAFGQVKAFLPLLDQFAEHVGAEPAAFLQKREHQQHPWFQRVYHRWLKPKDIQALLDGVAQVLDHHGSLGAHAHHIYQATDGTMEGFLTAYARDFRNLWDVKASRGRAFLVPDPDQQSTMKRLLMFIRWMVHPESPDFGLWTWMEPQKLWIPLDTHMFQFAHQFGWIDDKTPHLKTVSRVSDVLAYLYPEDPMKLDFVLTHLGISRACLHKWDPHLCKPCVLRHVCKKAKNRLQTA